MFREKYTSSMEAWRVLTLGGIHELARTTAATLRPMQLIEGAPSFLSTEWVRSRAMPFDHPILAANPTH